MFTCLRAVPLGKHHSTKWKCLKRNCSNIFFSVYWIMAWNLIKSSWQLTKKQNLAFLPSYYHTSNKNTRQAKEKLNFESLPNLVILKFSRSSNKTFQRLTLNKENPPNIFRTPMPGSVCSREPACKRSTCTIIRWARQHCLKNKPVHYRPRRPGRQYRSR